MRTSSTSSARPPPSAGYFSPKKTRPAARASSCSATGSGRPVQRRAGRGRQDDLLDGEAFTGVGVMQHSFSFTAWSSTGREPVGAGRLQRRSQGGSREPQRAGGRAAEAGRDARAGRAEMAAISSRLEREFPKDNALERHGDSLQEVVVGNILTPLVVLLGAVGLVLLIASPTSATCCSPGHRPPEGAGDPRRTGCRSAGACSSSCWSSAADLGRRRRGRAAYRRTALTAAATLLADQIPRAGRDPRRSLRLLFAA